MTWIRLPEPVPILFLQSVPDRSSPFSILTIVSPGVINPFSSSECHAENHDRHFMKTWLPIEKNKIPIIEMPLHLGESKLSQNMNFTKAATSIVSSSYNQVKDDIYLVTKLQMLIAVFLHIPKIKHLTIFPDNIFCIGLSWGRVRPIFNKFLQPEIIGINCK